MRALSSWLLIFAVAAFTIGCGGGGEQADSQPAKKTEAAKPAASTGDYMAMAVANGGTITGTVTYGGQAPDPKKLPVTKDTQVCGMAEHFDETLVVGSNNGIKDVVVSITGITSGKGIDALGAEFVLDQKGCLYSPHISLVPVNTSLKIINPDGILHNIHSYSEKNPSFNKSQPKFKKEMETSFAEAEVVTVKCDVHGWMSAQIFVVDHPYHAITDESGNYSLADVPPGTYTVEFWQEKLGKHSIQVTVAEGASTTLDHKYPGSQAASD